MNVDSLRKFLHPLRRALIKFKKDNTLIEEFVVIDEAFYRPAEVELLVGDPAKAEKVLGWTPTVGFEDLVTMMVDADLALLSGKLRGIS